MNNVGQPKLCLQVISARNIAAADCETMPDTYVKCYLKDGDRLRHKKKTRVIRHSAEPVYQQSLKYQVRVSVLIDTVV